MIFHSPNHLSYTRAVASVLCASALVLGIASLAVAEPARVTVTTVTAEPMMEEAAVIGTVIAPRSASVSSEIAGRIAEVAITLGDQVEADAPLVRLDPTLEELSLATFEAAERADVARLENAIRRLRDARQLVSNQNISRNELELRETAVEEAESILAQERAEIAQRRERIARHVVRAPFAGTVVARLVEAGEWIEPGDAVVDLVATEQLVVDLAVPQRLFPRINLETPVTLRFEAKPEATVEARVLTRVPRSDPTARSFRLRVEPMKGSLALAPGMSASATLRLDLGRPAVVVPRDAVTRYPDGRVTVWVLAHNDDGPRAEERDITLGPAAGGDALYVIDGLAPGDQVVTRGNEGLNEGQAVEIIGQPS